MKSYFFLNGQIVSKFLLLILLYSYALPGISQKGNYSILCVDYNRTQNLWAVILNNDASEKILDIVSISTDVFPFEKIEDHIHRGYVITSANYTGAPGRKINLTLTKYVNPNIKQEVFYDTWNGMYDELQELTRSGFHRTSVIDFNEFKNNNRDDPADLKLMVAMTKGLKSLVGVKKTYIKYKKSYTDLYNEIETLWQDKKHNIRSLAYSQNNCYAIMQEEDQGEFSQKILKRDNLTQEVMNEIYDNDREIAAMTSSGSRWYIVTEKKRSRNQATILSPENYPKNNIQQYLDFNTIENEQPVFTTPLNESEIENVKIHGLFIGINNYEVYSKNNNYSNIKKLNLESCVNDADSMYNYFEHLGAITKANGSFKFLPDKLATKNGILRSAWKLAQDAGPNDMLVLYFSGHGSPGDFIAYDSSVSYLDLKKAIGSSKAKIRFVISDCCFAGSWDNDSKAKIITAEGPEDFRKVMFYTTKGYIQLFASKENQVSLAGDSKSNSVFTEVLLDGLNGKADNLKQDGVITIEEISEYVSKNVPPLTVAAYNRQCESATSDRNRNLYCNNKQEPELKGASSDDKKLPIAFIKK